MTSDDHRRNSRATRDFQKRLEKSRKFLHRVIRDSPFFEENKARELPTFAEEGEFVFVL